MCKPLLINSLASFFYSIEFMHFVGCFFFQRNLCRNFAMLQLLEKKIENSNNIYHNDDNNNSNNNLTG